MSEIENVKRVVPRRREERRDVDLPQPEVVPVTTPEPTIIPEPTTTPEPVPTAVPEPVPTAVPEPDRRRVVEPASKSWNGFRIINAKSWFNDDDDDDEHDKLLQDRLYMNLIKLVHKMFGLNSCPNYVDKSVHCPGCEKIKQCGCSECDLPNPTASKVMDDEADEAIRLDAERAEQDEAERLERHRRRVVEPASKSANALGDTMMGENFPGSSGGNAITGQGFNVSPVSVTEAPGGGVVPGEGSTTITSSWISNDYLASIKQASDSEIYFRGFADGQAGKKMDDALSALSDDYFNGWQDGQIYGKKPVELGRVHLQDINPGSNNIPPIHASACDECGSTRVAHCGSCPEDLEPEDETLTEKLQVAGSRHYCKNCMNSRVVCGNCGVPKVAGSLDDNDDLDEIDDFFTGYQPTGLEADIEGHEEDCNCDACRLKAYDTIDDDFSDQGDMEEILPRCPTCGRTAELGCPFCGSPDGGEGGICPDCGEQSSGGICDECRNN